ncbi:MAG: hypothetical protein M1489_04640, partial [Firmicutes bacterium]|nr:hypothetical protein [Bacillota bacterium]
EVSTRGIERRCSTMMWMGPMTASILYILFMAIPLVLAVFIALVLWKLAKAHESLAVSMKEIAEKMKNN